MVPSTLPADRAAAGAHLFPFASGAFIMCGGQQSARHVDGNRARRIKAKADSGVLGILAQKDNEHCPSRGRSPPSRTLTPAAVNQPASSFPPS